jgi:hypothetical protein
MMVFIDYAQLYYREMLRTKVPSVISGKFVHIRHETAEYIVFSPKEFTKYHANIVERFCLDNGLEGNFDTEGKRYNIVDRAWSIAGGGKYEMNTGRKSIRLYDDSLAYGKFNKQNMADKILSFAEFTGFTVMIE